ncbi:MAG: hypothetical protein H6560_20955 [Lewinellaceae bacterium]|nr:hypothetical protein [Lewinellaceae bacterium]
MGWHHSIALLSLSLSFVVLLGLWFFLIIKAIFPYGQLRFSKGLLQFLLIGFFTGLFVVRNHSAFPQKHRLYYDEDVYANISANILKGYGGKVTELYTENEKEVRPYKWPLGFPVGMAPFVAALGPEEGPVLFNECCIALCLLILAGIAARLASNLYAGYFVLLFFGFHPIVGNWARAGSSEPLALLLVLLFLFAVVESAYRKKRGDGLAPAWTAAACIAGGIALHVRLENILILIPLILAFKKCSFRFSRVHFFLLFLTIPLLLLSYGCHLLSLGKYYMADIPESSFSLSYFSNNLMVNRAFWLRYSPFYFVLFGALMLLLYLGNYRKAGPLDPTLTAAAFSVPVVHFFILLFYSVGQYNVPGGSRFFLVQIMGASLAGAVFLAKNLAFRYGYVLAAAGIFFFFLTVPDRQEFNEFLTELTSDTNAEHEWVRRWSADLPEDAVVISQLPCLWENFGVYSMFPGYLNYKSLPPSALIYEHYGLFRPFSRPILEDVSILVDSLPIENDAVILFYQAN